MNKRLPLLAAALLLGASATASASEGWTGWHVGGHLGHGTGDSDFAMTPGAQWASESQALRDHVVANGSGDMEPTGAAYGLQFGYDHQFGNGFVLGAEVDYSVLDIKDDRASGVTIVASVPSLAYRFGNSIELDSQWSLRGRLGYASGQHLFFVSAGWVQVDANATATLTSNGGYNKLGTTSETLDGTSWGVGYEYDMGNQWTVRGEYTATKLDDFRFDTDYVAGSTFVSPAYLETVTQDVDFNTLRIAFNYRF